MHTNRIEFLVRDWQNFGHDIEDEQSPEEQVIMSSPSVLNIFNLINVS